VRIAGKETLQRILDPTQIEAFASRSVPQLVLPVRERVFAARARRLQTLAASDALGGYLRLAAAIAEAQHTALGRLVTAPHDPAQLAAARHERRPPLAARDLKRGPEWHAVLEEIAAGVAGAAAFPVAVGEVCERLATAPADAREELADRLLAADGRDADPAAAPFVIAALQVYWTALAASLTPEAVAIPPQPGSCPVCGTLPVASIVRAAAPYAGYRYLQCGLCASEWHRVRVECTQCGTTKGIAYHSIAGGAAAIRAETCDACHAYRKIFYEEHDTQVEPLADDLASVALDLLLAEAGFHRASTNPLLWQPAD
jgi:FdhE protein